MIEKIRKELIIKYTAIISLILFISFAASFSAFRQNGIQVLYGSLKDYLIEEVWEATEAFASKNFVPDIHYTHAQIDSLSIFTYWIRNNQIIHAEGPDNKLLSLKLEKVILNQNFNENKIFHQTIQLEEQKWDFAILKQNISPTEEVFVVANFTPLHINAKTYIQVALCAIFLVLLISYFVGNLFTTRSIKYIEQMYENQKQFVSDAAHELRTPLSILHSYAELLEYEHNKKQTISEMKKEILYLNNLLDKLLAMARYDNKLFIIQKEAFFINRLLKDIVQKAVISYKSDSFTSHGFEDNIQIIADKTMLRQLFSILIDNAFKYTTNNKKIDITLSQKQYIMIKIQDNGIGIKQTDLPHIFDRFWMADQSRHHKGLGVGLFLAQEIVKAHNGKITVESSLGNGTTFTIFLPAK